MRRDIRDMPVRRRHLGMTVLQRMDEKKLYALILLGLSMAVNFPAWRIHLVGLATALILIAQYIRTVLWPPLLPVNPANKNRLINSFTDEECYRDLRWYKDDFHDLCQKLQIPFQVTLDNGLTFPGEHAFILLLYKSHYPSTYFSLQDTFGREYTQLCRILNWAVEFIYTNHHHRVKDNIDWYSGRFDIYNAAYQEKIANSLINPNPGTVPHNLNCLFGSLDAQAKAICRPFVSCFSSIDLIMFND